MGGMKNARSPFGFWGQHARTLELMTELRATSAFMHFQAYPSDQSYKTGV